MLRALSAEEVTFVSGGMLEDADEFDDGSGGGGGDDGGLGDGGDYGGGGGDIGVDAPAGDGSDSSSNSTPGPDIVVTAPRGSDPNYEISVPDATRFACPVGNVPFFGNYGTPNGTLGSGTHITLTPAAYNKVAKGCVFNSGSGAYHLQAQ